jgi:phosphoglycolate phosphatase-like HAD superfamily hydrolase
MAVANLVSALLFSCLSSTQAFQAMTVSIPRVPTRVHSAASSSEAAASTTVSDAKSGGIRGVVFDIDGTLADSWNLGYQATLTVLTDYHNANNEESLTPDTYPLTSEEYHYGCRFTTPERLARHVGLEPGHDSFEEVGEALGKQFDDYYVQLVDKKTAGFYNGIGELLIKMHSGGLVGSDGQGGGLKIGALTNACVEYAHAVLKANCPEQSQTADNEKQKIYNRFSAIHGANSVPRPKPFGDGILQCCAEMGLHPSEVIYVGDAPTDAKAAVDAKCRAAIGVLWGSNDEECLSNETGFKALCSDVGQLENAIRKYL